MRFSFCAFLFLVGISNAETLLLVTPDGVFVSEIVTGAPPGPWIPIEEWWTLGQVIESTGGDTPDAPRDAIAVQVDKWTDEVNDPATRPEWASVWATVISDVESNKFSFDEAERHITVGQTEIIEELEPGHRSAWTVWNGKVSGLIDDQKRKGQYTIETFKSIHKGLAS